MAWWKDWLKRGGARPLRSNADDKAPKLSPVFLSNITAPQTQEPESQSGKLNNGAFSQKSTGPGDALRKEPQADHGAQDLRAFFQHDGVLVAFELNWQLLRDGQMRKQQAKALADGYTHQVIGVEGDLAGFIDLKRGTRDKRTMYSAALLIAEASSLSGDEVFVFRLDDTRHAMVALKNSMPVPGFDLVGSTEAISQAVQSYFSLPHKNEIRRCGDAAVLSGAEFFDFSAVLNSLDPSQPRIKPIPDFRKIFYHATLAAGAGLLLLLAWGGWTYFEAKAEAERLQRDSDPNLIYEQSYSNSIASLTSMGDPGLRNMINTIKNIPLEVRGWRLSQVACQPAECIVTWARLSGNYADFDENMPSDVKVRPEYGYLSSDAGAVQLKTRHPVVTSESTVVTPASAGSGVSPASSFTREKLPVARQVQSEFVSRLQDYQLIAARVQVSVPAPFPAGVTDIGPIFKPVIYGTWSMELPMWSIETISVPDYVLVDSLSLVLPEKKDADKSQLQYKISGKYYAKGKEY